MVIWDFPIKKNTKVTKNTRLFALLTRKRPVFRKKIVPLQPNIHLKYVFIMATAIRAIPTLYGETAKSFECEAKRTEQNPGTQDYRHEAKVVSDFLKTTNVL